MTDDSDLARNLRLLCSYRPSISQVGRDLGVHRSQMNRYLSGASVPRTALLRRIGDYFGVETHELFMPHTEFAATVRTRGLAEDTLARQMRQHFDRILARNDPRLFHLEGSFFEYYYSMSTPGKLIRSLIVFMPEGDHIFYRRLERIGDYARPCPRHYRYLGAALMTGDRIFLSDYEYSAGIEVTQTVLYPDYSFRWNALHGVKIGVSANRAHVPCCVRVFLERTPARNSLHQNLRLCGLYDADSPDYPAHIRPMIDNTPSGPHVFAAWSA